ncbi:FimV/HubP family polar landmark protein [Moraxella equi]|uniref:Tfp pilus assembly protein FimV n=1 Tax=Moraxella equi TaxID=60442 RepID=A0A378QN21_9GAMM|nr:FimV/HubP family polar landmark protein [Moraxella equi]OPH35434.1 hypothetical protein B5J93_10880 [Moraxella equi]STZ02245.1 Tfp pilus assembly protein FimV [Moraxella equi]
METIIIAIGAVVVIGIAAFFVLKKLQAQKSELPANPQAHIPAQQTSVAPTPTATSNDLATAEAHIRNQNYNEAIAELKRILMTNPRHNGAMLKLLQTYGVTKQFAAFNQLHQKIHEIADGETIREADFCKSLLEEEMSSAAIQTPAPTQTVTMTTPADAVAVAPQSEPSNSLDSGLDFEFETPEPTLATPNDNINELDFDFDTPQIPTPSAKSAVENNDFDLSFDVPSQETQPIAKPALEEPTLDFDDFSFDEPSSTPPANEPTLDFDMLDDDFNQGLGGALDIGLGGELNSDLSADFDTKPAPNTVAQTAPTPNSDELDAFDFNFDAPTPAPVPSASPVNSDDLGFDFDLTPEPVATPVTTTPANDLALDGFDFDADLSSPAQPTTPSPTPVSQADMSDLGGFDLSFDTQTTPAAPTPQTNADNGLGFDGLDADFGLVSEPEPAIKPAPTPATPSADFADFDLGLDSTPTPKPTPANTNDNLSFDNLDLGLDTQTAQPTPSKATTPTQDTALAFDANELAFDATSITETNDLSFSGFDFAETPAVTAPMSSPKVAPSAQPVTTASPVSKQPTQTAGVPSELSFVDNLDNTEVTLNLAKQYLDLGEYDSAKRLLDEVIQTGNATQQQNARELLTQLV